MEREGTFRTCCGRAFQARAAATGNNRSPRVGRRVDGTSRVDVSAEPFRRGGAGELNAKGAAKYSDFGPVAGDISETVQDRS